MINNETLRLFALILWCAGMFFFFVWAFIIAMREVFVELYASRLIGFFAFRIEKFFAKRHYKRARKEWIETVRELQDDAAKYSNESKGAE